MYEILLAVPSPRSPPLRETTGRPIRCAGELKKYKTILDSDEEAKSNFSLTGCICVLFHAKNRWRFADSEWRGPMSLSVSFACDCEPMLKHRISPAPCEKQLSSVAVPMDPLY